MSRQQGALKQNVESKFRAAGYISMDEAAKRIGVHYDTIRRWAESKEVVSIQSTKTWVHVGSLAKKFGLEASVLVGLISQEHANKLKVQK